MKNNLSILLSEHPIFKDMNPLFLSVIERNAKEVHVRAGQFLYREGADAHRFFIIRDGRVSLEMFIVGRGAVTVDTLGDGDLLGWSWLLPPHKIHFDARAIENVTAIDIDGKRLREEGEKDPAFGYELMKRIAGLIARRLHSTRMHLLEVYGQQPSRPV